MESKTEKNEEKLPKRDYISERNFSRNFLSWPLNVVAGLNAFEIFRGMNMFISHGINSVLSFVPFIDKPNYNCPIQNSIRLTRYRNYNDKII